MKCYKKIVAFQLINIYIFKYPWPCLLRTVPYIGLYIYIYPEPCLFRSGPYIGLYIYIYPWPCLFRSGPYIGLYIYTYILNHVCLDLVHILHYIYIYPEPCLLRTVPYIGSTAVVEVPPDQAEFVTLQTILEVGIQLYP